jgi:hypothetical protein
MSPYSPGLSECSVTAAKSSGRDRRVSSALFSDERAGSPLAGRKASSGPFRDAMTNASSEE